MAVEQTYAMIKPKAVKSGYTDKIIKRIQEDGFTIVAKKIMTITKELAEKFYAVHKEKPFFNELIETISAGPVVAMILEKDGAIASWRELMGATNPEEAAEGTLRKLYGQNISYNAVHGSDAPDTAETEISLIFPEL
jgi:nucleoside-diphosphate kinase